MDLNQELVIISGAASGMGAATARKLRQQGARVALLDLNIDAAQSLAEELEGWAFACDVSDSAAVEEVFAEIQQNEGAPRLCVNCAGIILSQRMVGKQGPMLLADFDKVLSVNVSGTFNLMRLAAASMINNEPLSTGERGLIINTASIAAFEGQIGQVAYSASKGAIVSMTLPAARELAQFGIRVMAIAPGLVDTPMFANLSPEAKAALAAAVPFPKRLAEPEEYADLVLAIAANPMLNGSVIRLDGALRMQAK